MFGAKLFTFLILNSVLIYGAYCVAAELFGRFADKYRFIQMIAVAASQFGVYFCFGGRM